MLSSTSNYHLTPLSMVDLFASEEGPLMMPMSKERMRIPAYTYMDIPDEVTKAAYYRVGESIKDMWHPLLQLQERMERWAICSSWDGEQLWQLSTTINNLYWELQSDFSVPCLQKDTRLDALKTLLDELEDTLFKFKLDLAPHRRVPRNINRMLEIFNCRLENMLKKLDINACKLVLDKHKTEAYKPQIAQQHKELYNSIHSWRLFGSQVFQYLRLQHKACAAVVQFKAHMQAICEQLEDLCMQIAPVNRSETTLESGPIRYCVEQISTFYEEHTGDLSILLERQTYANFQTLYKMQIGEHIIGSQTTVALKRSREPIEVMLSCSPTPLEQFLGLPLKSVEASIKRKRNEDEMSTQNSPETGETSAKRGREAPERV